MTAVFTRRELLGIGSGFAAATAGSVAGVVGLTDDRVIDRSPPNATDRLTAWTPASEAFAGRGVPAPSRITYVDLRRLRRAESTVDGRLRAVPHRWLTRLSRVTDVDVETARTYVRTEGRGIVQVHERDHDRDRLGDTLETLRYEFEGEFGGFDVYAQARGDNSRELRTIPHLDDAIAVDGDRIVTSGHPRIEDPVAPLEATLRARVGGPRLIDRDDAMGRLVSNVDEADLLTVAPAVQGWVQDGPPGTDGLHAYSRAVRFGSDGTQVRTLLLYDPGTAPDSEVVRSLFLNREAGSAVGIGPVERLRVDAGTNRAVVTARTPVAAFTEGTGRL